MQRQYLDESTSIFEWFVWSLNIGYCFNELLQMMTQGFRVYFSWVTFEACSILYFKFKVMLLLRHRRLGTWYICPNMFILFIAYFVLIPLVIKVNYWDLVLSGIWMFLLFVRVLSVLPYTADQCFEWDGWSFVDAWYSFLWAIQSCSITARFIAYFQISNYFGGILLIVIQSYGMHLIMFSYSHGAHVGSADAGNVSLFTVLSLHFWFHIFFKCRHRCRFLIILLLLLIGFVFGLYYLQAKNDYFYDGSQGAGWYDEFSFIFVRHEPCYWLNAKLWPLN